MSNRTYRVTEIVGTSPDGIDHAIRNGVERASPHPASPRLVRGHPGARPGRGRQGRALPGRAQGGLPAGGRLTAGSPDSAPAPVVPPRSGREQIGTRHRRQPGHRPRHRPGVRRRGRPGRDHLPHRRAAGGLARGAVRRHRRRAVEAAFTEVEDEHGPVEVLVANAGITRDTLLLRMSDDDWSSVIETNLTGSFRVAKRAAKGMLRLRRGRIVLSPPWSACSARPVRSTTRPARPDSSGWRAPWRASSAVGRSRPTSSRRDSSRPT